MAKPTRRLARFPGRTQLVLISDEHSRSWREKCCFRNRAELVLKQASAVYIVHHPDATGLFRHGQHEFVLGERKSDRRYPPWNHQSGAFKVRHLKRLPNSLSRGRIKVDPPDIEETAAPRNKINCPTVRRPARLIVPVRAVGNACPRATRRWHYVERGFWLG